MNWRRSKRNHPCGSLLLARQRLHRWHATALGNFLAEEELHQVDKALCNLFGYHLVQVGCSGWGNTFGSTRIPHCLVIDPDGGQATGTTENVTKVAGLPEALPIAADAVDVVVLPHVLEFTRDPHQVLREVDRILIAEGHVLILGYNPFSFWLLARVLFGWRQQPPWCGRLFSLARIKDWLGLLGFEVAHTRYFFYRPPLQHMGVLDRLSIVERLGRRLWPFLGGIYLVLAQKRVTTLTPIRPRWRPRRSFIPAGVVETQNRDPL